MHRFIPPLIALVQQDLYSSLRASLLTVLRVVYAIVRLSSSHGFDPPCGSHQLPVFLKYSVRLKLLAQLVHR